MGPTVQTVIFLDVDGVLNVGARHHEGAVLMSESSIKLAQRLAATDPEAYVESAEKILALANHPVVEEEDDEQVVTTLSSFTANEHGYSNHLVGSLVDIMKSANPEPQVVLASSWRHAELRPHAEKLRLEIQRQLGRNFNWADTTPIRRDKTAKERLRCIGDFVARMRLPAADETRLLVLDDFFVTPFNGWKCDGKRMRGTEDAEAYLAGCWKAPGCVAVKVVHPYEEIVVDTDFLVQAAVGLTPQHLRAACDFLRHGGGSGKSEMGSFQLGKSIWIAGRSKGTTAVQRLMKHVAPPKAWV